MTTRDGDSRRGSVGRATACKILDITPTELDRRIKANAIPFAVIHGIQRFYVDDLIERRTSDRRTHRGMMRCVR